MLAHSFAPPPPSSSAPAAAIASSSSMLMSNGGNDPATPCTPSSSPQRRYAPFPSTSASMMHARRLHSQGGSHASLASSSSMGGVPPSSGDIDSGMSVGGEPSGSGASSSAAGPSTLLASDTAALGLGDMQYSRSAPSAFAALAAERTKSPLAQMSEKLKDPLIDWKYEMRRSAQEVLPGLFVGPYQSSKNLPELQELGITHIVCLYEERERLIVKPRFEGQFQYLPLLVRDASDQNLISLFPAAKAFIDQALRHGGRVLVHCGDGISRSPAIVTAYVMCAMNASHEEAFNHVQSRRFCASPNTNFKRQIEAYESINAAMVAMAQYSGQAGLDDSDQAQAQARRRKRGHEDADHLGEGGQYGTQASHGRKRRDMADSDEEDDVGLDDMDMT